MEVSKPDSIDLHVELVQILQSYTSAMDALRFSVKDLLDEQRANGEIPDISRLAEITNLSNLDETLISLLKEGYQNFELSNKIAENMLRRVTMKVVRNNG